MGIKVFSKEELYERLLRQFHASYILVRATDAAKEKLSAGGLGSLKGTIKRALKGQKDTETCTQVDFEAEEDLIRVSEGIFEEHLLEAVTNNAMSLDSEALEFVGYPPWFTEWAVTLAKVLRITRYKMLSIPPESRGVMLFCTSDDSRETILEQLGKQDVSLFRAVVVIGETNSRAFLNELKDIYREPPNHFVANSDTSPLEESLISVSFTEFLVKIAEACSAQGRLESSSSSQKRRKSVPHISSKAGKARPTESDICAMRSIIMDMNEELHSDAPTGYIDMVCSSTDYEIQGAAYIYSALLHIKTAKKHLEDSERANEGKPEISEAVDKAIGDLDKSISIFLKYDLKCHALLAAIFMATIGKESEARRLGTISATMELKSKSDYARAALSLELCTFYAEKRRRKMFYLVMAGQLYLQAGLMSLTKRCFMLALPLYKEKGWTVASEFLHGTLSRCEPLFCIDALNGLADHCELLNCYSRTNSYEHTFFRSTWFSSDREMTHLRRLMKLSTSKYTKDDIREKTATSFVCCSYGPYPALLHGKKEISPIDENAPWLLRVPFVLLRNIEGVPGRNCELLPRGSVTTVTAAPEDRPYNTADDFDLQEQAIISLVKKKAEKDQAWKICYEFIIDYGNMSYRLDTDSSGYNLPKQKTKPTSNYLLGSETVIKLELMNPLHINIHCDDFHLLVEDAQTNWWEKASVMSIEGEEHGNDQSSKQSNFLYLVEGERRIIFLRFKMTKPGKFNVIGLSWKLFGCVACWVPLYLSGQRTTKAAPLQKKGVEEFRDYIAERIHNAGLSFTIHEMYPQVDISVTKPKSFPRNMQPFNQEDENLCILKHYFEASEDDTPDVFNNEGYLSMGEAISGEFVITKLSVKNIGTEPIESVTLNVKTSGSCTTMNYPLAYLSQSKNVTVIWEDMAKCNLGSITGNKTYQVTLKDEAEGLIHPGGVLSIFILMVPWAEDSPNTLCIQGKLTMSSKSYKLNGKMTFWRFYSTSAGPTVSYKYDHGVNNMLKCAVVNNSKEDIKSIRFFDSTGTQVVPSVRSPGIVNQDSELTLKGYCHLTTAIPYNPAKANVKMRWECDGAFGLIESKIVIDNRPRLLVKIRTATPSIKYTGAPSIVRIEFIFENPVSVTIPAIQVDAKPKADWGNEHNWFYVGILTGRVPDIPPNETRHIGFDVVLPLPGMYLFSSDDITIRHAEGISVNPCNELMIPVEA